MTKKMISFRNDGQQYSVTSSQLHEKHKNRNNVDKNKMNAHERFALFIIIKKPINERMN